MILRPEVLLEKGLWQGGCGTENKSGTEIKTAVARNAPGRIYGHVFDVRKFFQKKGRM